MPMLLSSKGSKRATYSWAGERASAADAYESAETGMS
jgi:hypothetical protein